MANPSLGERIRQKRERDTAPTQEPAPQASLGERIRERTVNPNLRNVTATDLNLAGLERAATARQVAEERGDSPDAADEAEQGKALTTRLVGPRSESAEAANALEARSGPDTPGKQVARVVGPRVIALPPTQPTQQQADEEWQRERRQLGALTGADYMSAAKRAVVGDAKPVELPEDAVKPWLQDAKDAAWQAIGGAVLTREKPRNFDYLDIARRALEDPDVQGLRTVTPVEVAKNVAAGRPWADIEGDKGAQTQTVAGAGTGLLARSGLMDAAGHLRSVLGVDENDETLLMADMAKPYDKFDDATARLYQGDETARADFDALTLRDLPAAMRQEMVSPDLWRRVASEGDPDLAALTGLRADASDDTVIATVEDSVPLAVLRRYQSSLLPDDAEVGRITRARSKAERFRGTEAFGHLGNLLTAAMMKPADDGETPLFVPSRFQDIMRWANVPVAATLIEADVHPLDILSPFGNFRPDGPEEGDESWLAKARAVRLPSIYGVESMVRSGAFNDWLDWAGFRGGGQGYKALETDPDSRYIDRVLTDTLLPDFGGRGYQDVYRRAGGDPNSTAGRLLGLSDFAIQFIFQPEDAPLALAGSAGRAARSAFGVRRGLKELGFTGGEATRIAADVAVTSALPESLAKRATRTLTDTDTGVSRTVYGDPLSVLKDAVVYGQRERLRTGALDPSALNATARGQLATIAHLIGVPDAKAWTDNFIGVLKDDQVSRIDRAAAGLQEGGPLTKALRDSEPYKARVAELDALTGPGLPFKSASDRDVALAVAESLALRAARDGDVADPAEFFARHQWQKATEAEEAAVGNVPGGGGGLGEGTLYSGAPSPTIASLEVGGFDPERGEWIVARVSRDGMDLGTARVPDAKLDAEFGAETARLIREKSRHAGGDVFDVRVPNPFARAVQGMGSDALVDVLRNLPSDDPVLTTVANHLVENADLHGTTVHIATSPDAADSYFDGLNAVELSEQSASPAVLVHEALHAATARAIRNPEALSDAGRAAVQDMHGLFDRVKRAAKDMEYDHYGLTSIDEFVAEAFSNEAFQDFLANLYVGNTDESMWSAFVRTLGRIFGFEDASALAEVLTLGERIIAEPQKPLPRGMAPGALASRTPDTVRGSIEPAPGPKPRAVTLFSGGGLVEEGLRGIIDPVAAVEANQAIGAHYAKVHGPHVRVDDVRNVDLSDTAGADYLHASPVCKNASVAKNITPDGEQPLDVETARATAKAIDTVGPRVFTLENVERYAKFDAMKIITDALDRNGYTWDAKVYDAADYGAPTRRKRLLLRAVKDGPLPPPPTPTGPRDWWGTVEDRAPALPDATVPDWMAARLDAAGVNWRNPDRPVIVMGGSVSKSVPYAYAGGPAPTFKATPKERHIIILPGGRAKTVTPRAIARMTGLPDTYALPESRELATTIIGNGVPPDLARSVFGPLLGSPEGQPLFQRSAPGVTPRVRGAVSPDATRWLIRLFRTGDIDTAAHELTHLLALVSDSWQARMAKVYDSVNGRLTVNGHEAAAEDITRAFNRQRARSSTRAALAQDALEFLGDVWTRIRNLPIVESVPDAVRRVGDRLPKPIPAEARVVWDELARPMDRLRQEVTLFDERMGRRPQVPVPAGKQPSAGAARAATSVERSSAEWRAALGLPAGDTVVDAEELFANMLGELAVERFRKQWGAAGAGGLVTLPSGRTAVPAARHEAVIKDANRRMDGAIGKPPTPVPGQNRLAFDDGQQAGLRRLIREVESGPLAHYLPDSLRGGADLSTVDAEDYNALRNVVIDHRAGAGAWREKRAEAAAVGGATRLLALGSDWLKTTNWGPVLQRWQERLVASFPGEELLDPVQRELLKETARELGEADDGLQRAWRTIAKDWREDGRDFTRVDLLRETAKSLPPEVVPPDAMDDLQRVGEAMREPTLDSVAGAADDIDTLFQSAPLGRAAAEQGARETEALRVIDELGRAVRSYGPEDPDAMAKALGDLGLTQAQADDAMGIVVEGVRRRQQAVHDVATLVFLHFTGSGDLTALDKILNSPTGKGELRDIYRMWYTGDWPGIFTVVNRYGGKTEGRVYHQGEAALNVMRHLNAHRVLRQFSERMVEAGMTGDVANASKGGLSYTRPYTLGGFKYGREAFLEDVAARVASIAGWKDTPSVEPDGSIRWAPGDLGAQNRGGFVNDANRIVITDRAYLDRVNDEALRQIAAWGLKPGPNITDWVEWDAPGGAKVLMPEMFRKNLQSILDESAPMSAAFGYKPTSVTPVGDLVPGATPPTPINVKAANSAFSVLWNLFGVPVTLTKRSMLNGLGPFIRPGYYVTQVFGGLNQMHQVLGARKMAQLGSQVAGGMLAQVPGARSLFGENAEMLRSVVRRLWHQESGVGMPPTVGTFGRDGRYWTDEIVADNATRHGLNSSLVSTEFTDALVEDLAAQEPTAWNKMMRTPWIPGAVGAAVGSLAGGPVGGVIGGLTGASLSKAWRKALDEGATAIDNYFRIATFMDAVKSGQSAEQAAETARRVGFDFNALTKWEKDYARKAVLFYAFQRRNQDLFWWTLLNNPGRLMAELRVLGGLQRDNLGNDSEVFVTPFQEGRGIIDFRTPLQEGHLENRQKGVATVTPAFNVADQLALPLAVLGIGGDVLHTLGDLMGVTNTPLHTDLSMDDAAAVLGRLDPRVQAFPAWAGFDIERMRMLDEQTAKVPQLLVDADYVLSDLFYDFDNEVNGGMLTRDILKAQPRQAWDDADAPTPGAMVYEVDKSDPRAAYVWWLLNNITPVGSMATTATKWDRVIPGGENDPRFGMTVGEEVGGLFGAPSSPVPTWLERRGQFVGDKTRELREDTKELEKGLITSGRGQ